MLKPSLFVVCQCFCFLKLLISSLFRSLHLILSSAIILDSQRFVFQIQVSPSLFPTAVLSLCYNDMQGNVMFDLCSPSTLPLSASYFCFLKSESYFHANYPPPSPVCNVCVSSPIKRIKSRAPTLSNITIEVYYVVKPTTERQLNSKLRALVSRRLGYGCAGFSRVATERV